MGAWATGAYEGYGSLKTTGEFIDQTYKMFNASPTERLRDSLEGRPTGSRGHGLVGVEAVPAGRLAAGHRADGRVFYVSAQSKQAVHDWFQRAEKAADTWNPLTPFANAVGYHQSLVDDDDAPAVYGRACALW